MEQAKNIFVSSRTCLDKPQGSTFVASNLLHNDLQSSEPWRIMVHCHNFWGRVAQYIFHLFYFHQLVLLLA